MKKTVLLAILDGFGHREETFGNAVAQAHKPNFDRLWNEYPNGFLHADGGYVGLPDGQMGNSEVGHLNIGAGRKVYQSLALINKEIKDGEILKNEQLVKAMSVGKEKGLHLMGLLSDGGVHSHIDHLFGLIDMAQVNGVKDLYVHAFLDGRDVDPQSGINFVEKLQAKLDEVGIGQIATVSGRYYAMDRDKRWERVELAYDAVVAGTCELSYTNAVDYVKASYEQDVYDEFVLPAVNESYTKINDEAAVVFYNFRPDRASQLAGVLTNPEYNPMAEENPVFTPKYRPMNLTFIQMMKFSDEVKGEIAYSLIKLDNTLGEYVSSLGLSQLRIAETEKYPHVTFFFDGGIEKDLPNASRILINSPKVATYDLKPEMSAYEVTDALLAELDKDYLDLVILNFANPDMVGHSGMLEPTKKAIEAVDVCLGKIIEKIEACGGAAIVTADHGNADVVTNPDGSPNTAHTTNLVPFIVVKKDVELDLTEAALCEIAPTLLDLLGQEQPAEMTGRSVIKK
ncbi:MAG: 2,3-bisphosphoglycerate-independent phosphoglycerate mutase [Mycoplasmatales bacterium]